jgi:SnoaL-like domain
MSDLHASRAAITDLVHTYALLVRRDCPEQIGALFAPDGWFEIRDGHPSRGGSTVRRRLDGPESLVAYLLEGKGRPHPVPMIHNLLIAIDGDTATASSVMTGPILGTPQTILGEYADCFGRVDGQWRFASRTFTIFPAE